jgi:hypothetical protein
MKSVCYFVAICISCIIFSCNPFKADHPQADMADPYATNLNAKNITAYADSIDQNLAHYTKITSLVYLLGDLSFYVEKFTNNNETILLVEHVFNSGNNKSIKRYYFKSDSLILQKTNTEVANEDGKIYKDLLTYLRSNTIFKIENRTATSLATLKSIPFIDVPLSQNTTADQSLLKEVTSLNEVVNGTDKFDMVFENITTYPDSRYIMLKSKIQNSYMASILVKEKDAFIDSLLNDPINFKDQKLNLKWEIQDHEAVYVTR